MNLRSSILGEDGRAKEAQSEFLLLKKDAIRQPDLAKSVQRYQLVVDESKARLNLALCPGAWLMPSRMIIYVLQLLTSTDDFRLTPLIDLKCNFPAIKSPIYAKRADLSKNGLKLTNFA